MPRGMMFLAFLRGTDGESILTGKLMHFRWWFKRFSMLWEFFMISYCCLFVRLYCKHAELQFETPEDELKYFLNKTRNSGWKWKGRTAVPLEHAVHCK